MKFVSKADPLYHYLLGEDDPAIAFAKYLGCEVDCVFRVIGNYPELSEETPEAFQDYQKFIAESLRIGNAASALAQAISKSEQATSTGLENRLGVSVDRIRRFAESCFDESEAFAREIKQKPRRGGKRRDALVVAGFVHDLFVRLDRPISAQHVSGEPVSAYGLAVEKALKIWSIEADWRRPSEAAIKGERIYSVVDLVKQNQLGPKIS